jgi:hypothetical protein
MAARRHGHPKQPAITLHSLKRHLAATQRRIKLNPENSSWARLDAAWLALADECREQMKLADTSGRAFYKHEYAACQEIAKVARDVEPRRVVGVVLAMYHMRAHEPGHFRSDRAFTFQLARRVRCLTERNVGITYDHVERRNKRVYRDVSPRAAEHMGELLAQAFGRSALHLAGLDTAEANAKKQQRDALDASLQKLK